MSAADEPVASGTPPTDITPASGTAPVPTTDAATAEIPASTSTAVTERQGAAPDGDAIRIPPSKPRPESPTGRSLAVRIFDVILVVLVVALSVFVTAKPVQNSDVLMHLATGRALVEGRYNPAAQSDPFAYTTEGVRWVNHSWLSDLAVYGVYKIVGLAVPKDADAAAMERRHLDATITTLAVLKVILVAVLALVLLRIARGGGGMVLGVVGVALALVAMSPYLLLRPIVVSLLFLGLTLWLLQRGGRWLHAPAQDAGPAPDGPVSWKNYWPLLPLFALWANLDEWFLLGPITVGLYALGQAMQAPFVVPPNQTQRGPAAGTPRPGELRALGVVFVAGLVACLLNPHHVFVFALPASLGFSAAADALAHDTALRELFSSSLHPDTFLAANLSAARLAYFPLLAFGLLSFGVNYNNLRWWRVLTFGFFLLLSVTRMGAVPFFAVVAGPVTALNFHDLIERLAAERDRRVRRERVAPAVLAAVSLLLVLAVAWPGTLHAKPPEHRVCFVNELDPSYELVGAWIKEQREQGRLSKGFNPAPESGDALAWYCPEARSFFDHRLSLFNRVAPDFVAVRHGLLKTTDSEDDTKIDWQKILEQYGVDHVVVYAPAASGLKRAFRDLKLEPRRKEPKDWAELYKDGRTLVFGWAKKQPAYRLQGFDPERMAYSPAKVRPAPAEGMPHLPAAYPFWETYLNRPVARSLESDEAALHVLSFQVEAGGVRQRNHRAWQAASVVGALAEVRPGPLPMVPPALMAPAFATTFEKMSNRPLKDLDEFQQLTFGLHGQFLKLRDEASPAHLLLAVRAARRALAQNPDDAHAHLQLGHAYYFLLRATRERNWDRQDLLGELRYIQAVASFNQALLLDPSPEEAQEAHARLVDLYGTQGFGDPRSGWRGGFWDLQLRHLEGQLRATKAAGPARGESAEAYEKRVEQLEKNVADFGKEVAKQADRFKNRKTRLVKVLDQASAALENNLADQALKILRDSDLAAFGNEGMRLQITLALRTGLVRDVHAWFNLDEDQEKNFIEKLRQDHYRFKGLLAAAIGEYTAADQAFAEIEAQLGREISGFDLRGILSQVGTVVTAQPQTQALAVKDAMAICASKMILQERTPHLLAGTYLTWERRGGVWAMIGRLDSLLGMMGARAQYIAMRGLLALEAGDLEKAERLFRRALTVWKPKPSDPAAIGVDFPFRVTAQEWLEVLEKYKK
jgi:hypothetical protein